MDSSQVYLFHWVRGVTDEDSVSVQLLSLYVFLERGVWGLFKGPCPSIMRQFNTEGYVNVSVKTFLKQREKGQSK